MQNRIFKRLINWLLIASPLWWTTGCYTTREITRLDEIRPVIEVVTKGDRVYTFTAWTYDSLKGISGDARWVVKSPRPWVDSEDLDGHITLTRDAIKTVTLGGGQNLPLDTLQTLKPTEVFEINVVTKSGINYTFIDWTIDKAGTIEGRASWENPSYSSWSFSNTNHQFIESVVNLPADSIKIVSKKEYSSGRTTLLVVGSIVGSLGMAVWVTLACIASGFKGGLIK